MLDYADQRYYTVAYGRFNTADPYGKSAKLTNPGSWNRYTYASDDPVNRNDPSGRIDCPSYYLFLLNDQGLDEQDAEAQLGSCSPYTTNGSASLDPCSQQAIDYGFGDSSVCTPNMPTFSVDVNICTWPEVWTGDACDFPLDPAAGAIFQQVGQNMQGFNGLLGFFAGGSAAAGTLGALAPLAPGLAPLLPRLGGTVSSLLGTGGSVVLGPSGWTTIGGIIGANVLNIPEDVWEAMQYGQQVSTIQQFLTTAVNTGQQIIFTINPALAAAGSWTAFEANYLTQTLNQQIIASGSSWVVVP